MDGVAAAGPAIELVGLPAVFGAVAEPGPAAGAA